MTMSGVGGGLGPVQRRRTGSGKKDRRSFSSELRRDWDIESSFSRNPGTRGLYVSLESVPLESRGGVGMYRDGRTDVLRSENRSDRDDGPYKDRIGGEEFGPHY